MKLKNKYQSSFYLSTLRYLNHKNINFLQKKFTRTKNFRSYNLQK